MLEFLARFRCNPEAAKYFANLARDILRVGVLSMSVTALLGSVMLVGFVTFYAGFMNYMGTTFKDLMPVYATVFLAESSLLLLYYYSWDRMTQGGRKWVHMSIGVFANAMGLLLLLMANAWASFMMAPAGIDDSGRFLGNVWHLLHSPLWNPLSAHRFLAENPWSPWGGITHL